MPAGLSYFRGFSLILKGYFYLKVLMLAMILLLGIFSTISVTHNYKKSHREEE